MSYGDGTMGEGKDKINCQVQADIKWVGFF